MESMKDKLPSKLQFLTKLAVVMHLNSYDIIKQALERASKFISGERSAAYTVLIIEILKHEHIEWQPNPSKIPHCNFSMP